MATTTWPTRWTINTTSNNLARQTGHWNWQSYCATKDVCACCLARSGFTMKRRRKNMEFKRHFNKHYFLSNFVNQAQAHHFFSLIAWNIFFCACFATFFRENWVKSVLMELPWTNTVNFLGFHVSGNIILPHAVLLLAPLLVCSLVHSRWLCYNFFPLWLVFFFLHHCHLFYAMNINMSMPGTW